MFIPLAEKGSHIEFFHSTNVSKNNKLDRCLLTESVSVLYEFLLYDYLIKNNISKMDNVVIMIDNINHIIDRCDYLYDELVTMEKALSNINEINNFDLINEEDKNESDHDFYEGVDKLTNYIRKDVKYVISGVIAVIIYYRYKNDYIKMDSIYDFNNSIKTTEELDSLKILFVEDYVI